MRASPSDLNLISLLFVSICFELFGVSVEYGYRDFRLRSGSDRYRIHVIRPTDEKESSSEGKDWLNRIADLVDSQAKERGHLNDVNRENHEKEIELLRDGKWPSACITIKGKEKILLTVSFAIRWSENELPPFADRFNGKVQGFDLSYLENIIREGPAHRYLHPYFSKLIQLNEKPSLFTLIAFLYARPWISGEVTEIKFLASQGTASRRLLGELHRATVDFELHLHSRIPVVTKHKQWADFQNWMKTYRPDLTKMAEDFRLDVGSPKAQERLQKHIIDYVYEPDWHPYTLNSMLFAQVSDPIEDLEKSSSLAYQFIMLLGFPFSMPWSFEEDERSGTPGIFTHIFAISTEYYQTHVGRDIKERYPAIYDECVELLNPLEKFFLQALDE